MSQTATWLHAAFDSPADAQSALEQLAEDGVAANDIEVRSSIPLVHEVCPVGLEVHSRVPLMAVAGGLLGGTAAFLLVSLTSLAYPLPTGGMPIVPLPTVGVITFEGLALGAILCTVATVLCLTGRGASGMTFRRTSMALVGFSHPGLVRTEPRLMSS